METYPFERQPKLNKEIMALYDTMDFLPKAEYYLAGRNRLRQNRPGHQLSHPRHSARPAGRYVRFSDLLNQLLRSQADRSQARTSAISEI